MTIPVETVYDMDAKTRTVALLLLMSFATFLFCVLSTFVFSAALDTYTKAGDEASTTMLVGLGALVLLPIGAVHSVVGGWRTMVSGTYGKAALWALAPIGFIALDSLILNLTGLW